MSHSLKSVYFDEAQELLQKLEVSLLALESKPTDKQLLEEAFRSMHTLKGNSSMFRFDKIADFLHEFETIYSWLRDGNLILTKELLDLSLRSLDHLSKIITDPDLKDAGNVAVQQQLLTQLRTFLDSENSAALSASGAEGEEGEDLSTFYISFTPHPDVLQDGTRPMYLLDELSGLGQVEVIPHFKKFDSIPDIDFTKSHVSWEVLLATKSSSSDILDVFVFVEDESQILIEEIAPYGLLNEPETQHFIKSVATFSPDMVGLEAVRELEQSITKRREVASQDIESDSKTSSATSEKAAGSTIRVSTETLGELMNLLGELVTAQAGLTLYASDKHDDRLEVITESIEKISRQLRDTALNLTLVQLENIFPRFQRLVRDLSSKLDKSVDFMTTGGDTSLDKKIIEIITDPLMHIIRNCLDHGIEDRAQRIKQGKSEKAQIKLDSFYSGGSVHIRISDDGRGIDPKKIRAKATEKGLIGPHAVLSEKEILNLIFAPGFSTASQITDVSGRGVGMDVVRRNLDEAKGKVSVSSEVGVGTTVEIILPLTLSIIDGLLVEADDRNYVIPLEMVEKCYETKVAELETNINQTIILDGEQVPLVTIDYEFGDVSRDDNTLKNIIAVKKESLTVGLLVDSIVGELQAVLKPVGKFYAQQDFVTGATILGDGTVALVLDPFRLIKEKIQNKAIAS